MRTQHSEQQKYIAGRQVNLIYGDIHATLYVDMSVGLGGDKWPAAELFCQFISDKRWSKAMRSIFGGKRVVELGSGNALVSIILSKIYQPEVIITTDLESHIDLMRQNLALNNVPESVCRAESLDWNEHACNKDKYDVILVLEW